MKRLIIFIILMVTTLLLTGCYDYGRGSQYGQLVDIKFYDLEYVEIEGEWVHSRDLYSGSESSSHSLTSNRSIRPVNSPAPDNMYYVTEVEVGSSVITRIIIKANNEYQFDKIAVNNDYDIRSEDLYNVEVDDEFIYLDYLCENITSESNNYTIHHFYMTKEFESGIKTVRGSLFIEGRTYYSGFLFRLEENPTV